MSAVELERVPVQRFRAGDLPEDCRRRLELFVDYLPDGQHLAMPALVARGAAGGRTLLVVGAVHGDEYEGPVAIQDVFETLDPSRLRGTFVGIPVLNGPAFAAASREGSWDHLNLARVFPGSATGSPTLRIAHALREWLLPQCDLLLDIHSGGNAYRIMHLAGYQLRDGEVGRVQREAAVAVGADLVWGTAGLPGRTLSAAGELGIPAIYVEMPGEGRCRPQDRERARQGLRNVLAYLGMIDGAYPTAPPPYFVEMSEPGSGHLQGDHVTPTSGLFLPSVEVWDPVERDQVLGVVRHPDGRALTEIRAARAGRVLFLRTLPRVVSGDAVAFVLRLPGSDA